MASPTRSSSTLGRRSIVARIAAVLALAACGVAIYLRRDVLHGERRRGLEERQEEPLGAVQERKAGLDAASYTVAAGDTLSAIAVETGVPEPRIERLNPEIDAETLNAGQILALR